MQRSTPNRAVRAALSASLGALLALSPAGCADDPEPGPADAVSDATDGDAADTALDGSDASADAEPDGDGDGGTDLGAGDTEGDADAAPTDPVERLRAVEARETWLIPTLEGEAHVVFTPYGVPHIYAENERDLYRVEGYLVGRDRYFEFEMGRRLALGELSALLGDITLASDQNARGRGMTHVVDRLESMLGPEDAAIFDAFAEGINAYIAAVQRGDAEPPSELVTAGPLLGVRDPSTLMRPVSRREVMGFAGTVIFELGWESTDVRRALAAQRVEGHFDEAPLGELRQAGLVADVFEAVAPLTPVSSARGAAEGARALRLPGEAADRAARAPIRTARVPDAVLQRVAAQNQRFDELLGRGNPATGRAFGSNAWAVGGAATGSGAVVAGDGHLGFSVPALFAQIGLDTSLLGGGDIHQEGLVFAGFPLLAVGTNGDVAWSQTYLGADVTDWYAEEVELGEDGRPVATRFGEERMPLTEIEEVYTIADVPVLSSVGRTETWSRWVTFDGRWLASIEGTVVTEDTEVGEGAAVVTMMGDLVIPGDVDEDGVVSAVSFDYTGHDVNNLIAALRRWGVAESVEDMRAAHADMVAYSQNVVAGDRSGSVYYSGFNAMPCRTHLPRGEDGAFVAGADPRALIDGTRFGAFEIPVDEDGSIDWDAAGGADPSRCVIPIDEFPYELDPPSGYVSSANNDIGDISHDGSLTDDLWYLGGPWDVGYRALVIDDVLAASTDISADPVAAMSELQANWTVQVAFDLAPALLGAIDAAREARAGGTEEAAAGRLIALLEADESAIDEVYERVESWLAGGARAVSGVETFYDAPSEVDRTDAVATMIFHAWYRAYVQRTLYDEDMDFAFDVDQRGTVLRALVRMVRGRGPGNPEGLASWSEDTEESVFFDVLGTEPVERSDEVALLALAQALEELRAAPRGAGRGGFGTEEMSEWLWGLRHLVVFDSILADYVSDLAGLELLLADFNITPRTLPLAETLEEGDPRRGLPWFPRSGGEMTVDAANVGFDPRDSYWYGSGAQMRMVLHMSEAGVRGVNVIPGGQSGLTDSPHFADQAALWLGNEAIPVHFGPDAVLGAAEWRAAVVSE